MTTIGGFKAGSEFLVNSTTGSSQAMPDVAPLASGGFVAVYLSGYSQAIGQRFTADGAKIGPEFLIGASRDEPYVAPLPGGGFIVVWARSDDYAVVAQRYSDSGETIGDLIVAAPPADPESGTYRSMPAIALLAAGEIVIAWSQNISGGEYDVHLQRFDAAFAVVGEAIVVNTVAPGSQYRPIIAPLAAGGFAVQWRDNGASPSYEGQADLRLFDASGAPVGGEFSADGSSAGDQSPGHIAALPTGGFVSVWPRWFRNSSGTAEYSIEAQIFDSAGARVGAEIVVSPSTIGNKITPTVLALSGGFFLIAWSDGSAAGSDGSQYGIRAQMFDAAGVKVGAEFIVNETTQSYQLRPAATLLESGGFVISWSDNSGLGGDTSESVKARIFEPNALARADSVATDEASVLMGNLFADNGAGADSGTPLIAGINGLSSLVGQTIALPSGALLTVRSDGSFVYDPAGKYNGLAAFGSGASNTSATERFSYTLSSGTTAEVTLTIRGVESAGDMLQGSLADDAIAGGAGGDLFLLDQGGDDHATGGGGNDRFYLGAAFDADDRLVGGDGEDSLILSGNLSVTFAADTASGIERLRLLSGDGVANGFNLTTHDATVVAGARLLLDAQDLEAGETVIFNGSAELDGRFELLGGAGDDIFAGGALKDILSGGAGADRLYGMAGDDRITGGAGADRLNGGYGADRYVYASAAESTGATFDVIEGFDYRSDRIDLPGTVANWGGYLRTGTLSAATFDADLAAAVNGGLAPGGALLFRANAGDFAGRIFLVADADGDGSYLAGADYLIEMVNPVLPGSWDTGLFI